MADKAAPSERNLLLSAPARQDISHVLQWTQHAFGAAGRTRYEALISAALIDLRADPTRAGVRPREDIGASVYTYHLVSSRKRISGGQRVAQPRHLFIFRVSATTIEIARLLHDAMDFVQHGV